jgi:hypothetical protein
MDGVVLRVLVEQFFQRAPMNYARRSVSQGFSMHLWLRIGYPTLRLKRSRVHLTPPQLPPIFQKRPLLTDASNLPNAPCFAMLPLWGALKARRREVIGSCMPPIRNSINC